MCSTYIYDGETGERFDQPATVGITYFLKLGQWLKIKCTHVALVHILLLRSKPFGGVRAQFGGQRFGEMEV